MGLFIFSIIICLIIVDFLLVGLVPKLIGIWPALSDYIDATQKPKTLKFYTIKTNSDNKLFQSLINYRVQILKIVLTEKFLIIRNTLLTCLTPIKIDEIKYYTVESGIKGKRLHLAFDENGAERYLKFWPDNLQEWEAALKNIEFKSV